VAIGAPLNGIVGRHKMDWGLAVVSLILGIYLLLAIRVAKENERFVVFAIGRFAGIKGPGLLFKVPGGAAQWVRVALGAEGEVQSDQLVLVAGHPVPYFSNGSVRAGTKVRVVAFGQFAVVVEPMQQFFVRVREVRS
jgi:hypothetical protein